MVPCRRAVAALLIAIFAIPTAALAQQQDPRSAAATTTPAPQVQRSSTNSDINLPVSLERIRRELIHQSARTKDQSHGLDIKYYVEVYGHAPQIQIFSKDTDLVHGPVPYGGMTHQEFLNLVTPQEYRAPAADLTMLPMLLAKWLADRQKEKKKQEDASKQ